MELAILKHFFYKFLVYTLLISILTDFLTGIFTGRSIWYSISGVTARRQPYRLLTGGRARIINFGLASFLIEAIVSNTKERPESLVFLFSTVVGVIFGLYFRSVKERKLAQQDERVHLIR